MTARSFGKSKRPLAVIVNVFFTGMSVDHVIHLEARRIRGRGVCGFLEAHLFRAAATRGQGGEGQQDGGAH